MMSTWTYRDIKPPQWFIDAPKVEADDVALTPSVASGYELQSLSREPKANPFAVLGNPELLETDSRRVVADWTCNKVVYKHPPPEERPIRTEYKVRRSARLHKCPYDRDGPPPSPTRNGRRALLTCRRNFELVPPSWAERNGRYPTRTFSSNDWAYFQYGVHLLGSRKPYLRTSLISLNTLTTAEIDAPRTRLPIVPRRAPGGRPDALVLLLPPAGPRTYQFLRPPTQHPQMAVEDYFDADICDLSGATEDLSFCRLIDLDAVKGDMLDVARQGWVFGLPRGGLIHYLRSRANTVVFRQDITKMFCRGEFILVPTFRAYLDCMAFLEQKGVKNRSPSDRSRRRPLTALKSHRGLYRYVFIPFTDAARALQAELNLQPQTLDDLNNGVCPLNDTPMREGTDSFPILECAAHPFSICEGANKILWMRGTELTGQWHNLVGQLMEHWIYDVYDPPRWFVNAPVFENVYENVELTPSVARGHAPELLVGEPRPDPSALLVDATVGKSDHRKVVADWTCNKVIYALPPPEEGPIRTGHKSRRRRKCPYDRGESPPSRPRERRLSTPRKDPPPSPVRNVPDTLIACCRNYEVDTPSWAERNGEYPTHTFSSNDWAFFQYGIYLPGAVKT